MDSYGIEYMPILNAFCFAAITWICSIQAGIDQYISMGMVNTY